MRRYSLSLPRIALDTFPECEYTICMKLHSFRSDELPTEKLASLHKALAHPVRLLILHVLLQGEACVCHLTCLLERPQPYVSQQLGVLRDAGLLASRRDGQVIFYRVADPAVAGLIALSQQVVQAQGLDVDLPDVPERPLPGCTCPKCGG